MGGFLVFLIFCIILCITILFLILRIITKNKYFTQAIMAIWGVLVFAIIGLCIISIFTSKIELDKKDYYGNYIIDRNYFSGYQSDWQYNNFRFEIFENDSINFYLTDGPHIIQTFKGTISTLDYYPSERLVIQMEKPTHHIMDTNPTIHREVWGFYLTFDSPKFHNLYFRKGVWKKI